MNSDKVITVVGKPHPLRTDRIVTTAIEGQSIQQIITEGLNRLAVPKTLRDYGHVYVNDKYINPNDWSNYYPVPGDTINYRVVPQGGGGGKNPFKTLLSIVVIAVASIAGNAVGGMFAGSVLGHVAGAVTTMGITALGMLAINALFPYRPESLSVSDNSTDSSVYSLSGATNSINKFGAIPVLLGKHRVTPPQAALPYTELSGDNQYVMQLFCNGYTGFGIEELSNFRVGETNIANYDEFNIDRIYSATSSSIPKYYQNDVYENSLSIELKSEDGWNERTTDQLANSFSIDIVAPNGLRAYSSSSGKMISRTVELEVRWRKQGDLSWNYIGGNNHYVVADSFVVKPATLGSSATNIVYVSLEGDLKLTTGALPAGCFGVVKFDLVRGGRDVTSIVDLRSPGKYSGLAYSFSTVSSLGAYAGITVSISAGTCTLSSTTYTEKQTKAIRKTLSPGNASSTPVYFEIGIRRVTADTDSSTIVDSFVWATLRSVRYRSPIGSSVPIDVISTRVKATGELNGTIDEFNFDAISVCKDWDTTTGTWVIRGTNNPASLFRFVLQHPANAKPKSDSSINLQQLQVWHEFCDLKGLTYNRYFDFRSSVIDVLREIASAGLARLDCTDSLWSVIIDKARDTVVQMFTPRNSWGFKATRYFPEIPHGWRVTFVNEQESYQADEMIVYSDDYSEDNATLFEGIEFPGVTNPDQIIKIGRQYYAEAALCQEEFSFEADFEHLVCTRGDRIKCSHYVPMWGSSYGRVKSVNSDAQTIIVDEPCLTSGSSTYVIRWRDQESQIYVRDVESISEDKTTVYLRDTGSLPSKGDLFVFGVVELDSVDLLIKEIRDRGEYLTARLICKPYIPEIFDAVSKPLPEYETKITQSTALNLSLKSPSITSINSFARMASNTAYTGLRLSFSSQEADNLQTQYRKSSDNTWTNGPTVQVSTGVVEFENLEDSTEYFIRARAVRGVYTSDWVERSSVFSVDAATEELRNAWVSSLSDFSAKAQDNQIVISWLLNEGVQSFEVRYGETWETASVLSSNLTTSTWYWRPLTSGSLKFHLKGIIVTGRYTTETASFTLAVTPPKVVNLTKDVIGNNVLLYWDNEDGTYAIDRLELRKGLDYDSAEIIGTVTGSFTNIFESTAGTYKYWITPIDKAGLVGIGSSSYAMVNKPANYVLLDEASLLWTGESENILEENGVRVAPVNLTETWEDHFVTNSFSSPQDQIDSGLPYFLQPTDLSASYTEIIDHGANINLAMVTLALTRQTLVGTVTVAPLISVSLDGENWVNGTIGDYQYYGTNFRYTKISISISTPDSGLVVIDSGNVTLDVQIKKDSGVVMAVSSDVSGTSVPIVGYADIRSIRLSAKSTTPVITTYDFNDVGNPTEFFVYAWDRDGNRVNVNIAYELEGV